jgi:hypothetical protein
VDRYRPVSRSTRLTRRRFVPFVVFFLLAALLTQANVSAAGTPAPTPPAPPSEKLLAEYGQWETEYWPDTGGLSYNYVGDPNPTAAPADKQNANPDFVISSPSLLTAIIDVHVNPSTDAQGATAAAPGSLALVDAVGNDYGPFAAEAATVPGRAGAVVMWVALVDHIELPSGHYWVHDSDPSSLLGNAQTFNVGATIVKGVDAAAYARYMDALIAVDQPQPENEGSTPTPVTQAGGTQPEKVTYSNPQPIVNSSPDPAVTSYPANNPSEPCQFVTDKPMMVTKIMDYHINDGKGASPKLIGLQEHVGTWYGSWQAYGQAFNGIPNAIWVVTPNFEIPAGSYKVQDNEFSTLSAGADNRAMCVVKLAPVATSPIDNVTGKYTIDFMGDDGTDIDYPLVLGIIDHKNSVEIGTIVEGQPFKFNAAVTERANGAVKADFRVGFSNISIAMPMTFTKKSNGYTLSGTVIVLGDQGGTIGFSGARTSTDLPGFIPKPAGGLGKVGSIPGPGSAGQAAAGIAFPTLATLIAGSAAVLSGGGYGGGYGGDSGDSSSEDGGADFSGEDGGTDTGGADSGVSDSGGAETGVADDWGGGSAGAGDGGSGAYGTNTGGATDASPVAVTAPSQPAGLQDGQTMSVHDYGDGTDKTYVYHAESGGWINPLSGGAYVAANYATSAQDTFETDSEIKKRADADAYALAEGPNQRLAQIAEDGKTRLRLLAEIQKTQRAIYDTPGAEGEGPVSSSDRMDNLAEGVASGQISIADAQALLNRQKQFDGDIHVGKAGTQSAADLAASQDTAGAAIAHLGNDAVQGAYNAATDVQGKTWSGLAVRTAAGYLTGGASEVLIYIPANIAIKANENMDAGDSATRAFASAFISEGLNQAAQAAAMYSGGAALKGAASALGIKPGITLPTFWGKTLNTDVGELLPGAAGKTAGAVGGVEAQAVENLAVHNAEFGATNRDIAAKLNKLNEDALNGPLTPDQIKAILADREARRALEAGGTPGLKQSFNDVVDTQINKPSLDYTKQALTEKYGSITDPAHPSYQYKKMLDDGYTVETTNFRTPNPGEKNLSVNADNDVAGYMVKYNEKGEIIHQHDLPAHDVMTAHSEGFSHQCDVYNPETRIFDATRASSELGIDFKDPKLLTNGMSKSDLAKFGVNEDLSNLTPDRMTQLQLDKYARAYGNEVPGVSGKDFIRDFSTSDSVMRVKPGVDVQALPQSTFKAMQAPGGQGGLLDPQGLALAERNKVLSNWNDGSVRGQMEALESLRKMGKAANIVTKGYGGSGMKPLPENMKAALSVAADRSLSPAVRAQKMVDLGVGDPLTFADKLSGYIEGAKMATGNK